MDSTTGRIFSNKYFRMDESASLNFYVSVTDSAGHEDEALVTITIISYEQQVELIFDAPSNIISVQLNALQRNLNRVKLPSQQRAKQALLNKFGLIRAEPSTLMNDDDSEFTSEIKPVVYGLVISLSCLLIVLIILCCRQRRKHAKRLRGAGVADYSAVAMTRTLPRTGICHSKSLRASKKSLWKDKKVENNIYPQQLIDALQSTEL
ncbi:unnamed protein product [Enterobius vermicularis]|uniref:Cadherin domain-containing protein n=1 Tax=Enterobius vermicularis TaxID=51028 RepID=A0A0N4USV9_ENTVE|nr:unnamed protein product [Enterobius vermicularis]